MAEDSNIIIKITSETDLTDAQLELQKMQDESKKLAKQMDSLSIAEQKDAESIKQLRLEGKELSAALKENERYYESLRKSKQAEINQNEKSITSYKKSISTYNALNGESAKMTTRIRLLKEALMQMELAGDTSSEAFVKISSEVAKLQDQMQDSSKQIKALASDTKNLDAMIDVASGLTGAFSATTSAVALLSGENEELQKAFLKVQAAMSILNGIQQVANTLNKDSTANVVLRTALTKLFTRAKKEETVAETTNTVATSANTSVTTSQAVATNAATTATKSFTKALLKNPAMLVVAALAALVAGLVAAYEWFKKGAKEAREYEKAMKALEASEGNLAVAMSKINKERESALMAISKAEREYENDANSRNASELERTKKSIEFARMREKEIKASLESTLKSEQDNFNAVTEAKIKSEKVLIALYGSVGKALSKESDANDENREKIKNYREAVERYNDALVRQYNIKTQLENVDNDRINLENEYKDKLKELKKEERDMMLSLLKDGQQKEIALINARYDDERKTIIRKYGSNTTLIKGLEEKRLKEIQAVRDKSTNEFLKLDDEYNVILAEIASAENPFNKTLDIVEVKAKATASINEIKRQIDDLNSNGGDNSAETIRNLNAEIERIEKETNKKVLKLEHDKFAEEKNIANLELQQEINKNNSILQNEKTKTAEKKRINQETSNMVLQQISNEMLVNDNAYQQGLISYETYLQNKVALEKKYNDEIANTQKELQTIEQQSITEKLSYAQMALQTLGQIADEIFGAIQDKISREMEALDEMYTTDSEEAKNNADKKYISEKELANKKLELKRKQAAADKASAAFSIAINTAMAIMRIWADVPKVDFGASTIALTAVASAIGAAQLAMALAKPLPAYAKGRKALQSSAGEYALVGEKGAEIMFVPKGAGIIPHDKIDKQDAWGAFNVPKIKNPAQINMDNDMMSKMQLVSMLSIDYNRLGKAVADNVKIPKQTSVSVNVDRNGVTMSDGIDTHRYLNKKYAAVWN